MPLIQLIVAIIVLGLIIYAVEHWLPIPLLFKQLIYVLVVLIVVIWLLEVFGLLSGFHTARLG